MKILLTYIIIGAIIALMRVLFGHIVTHGEIWKTLKSGGHFGKFIYTEMIIGTFIWPVAVWTIIRTIINLIRKNYEMVNDEIEVIKETYLD